MHLKTMMTMHNDDNDHIKSEDNDDNDDIKDGGDN